MIPFLKKSLYYFAVLLAAYSASAWNIEYFDEFQMVEKEASKQFEKYNKHARRGVSYVSLEELEKAGAEYDTIRDPLIRKYAWAIPNVEALDTIKSLAPIFELGSGGGYWAKLLKEMGTDIIAVDNDSILRTRYAYTRCWEVPIKGDERLLEEHPDRALFLCWPDGKSQMASRALAQFAGEHVILVGDRRQIRDRDPRFFHNLAEDFALIDWVAIPVWPGYRDQLFVYRRLD